MGTVGGIMLLNKGVEKITGYNALGHLNNFLFNNSIFGGGTPKEAPISLGSAHSYNPLGNPSAGGGASAPKTGLSGMFGGSTPQEAPISLNSAHSYNPLEQGGQSSGKAGTQPSWNAGAENYTPIVMAQAGPDLRGYFSDRGRGAG